MGQQVATPRRGNVVRSRAPATAAMAALALAALAAAGLPVPTAAQAPSRPWTARVGYERDLIDSTAPQWTDWQRWSVGVMRGFEGGSVAVELMRSRRFGLDDDAAALDLYLDLASRTYVNARAQIAPDARVSAEGDYRVELYQGFGTGWEGSAGARLLSIGGRDVRVFGASLARYLPGWYLRARADLNPSFDHAALLASAAARRYLTGPEGFVELAAGTGEEVVEVAPGDDGADADIRGSRFVALRAELFPHQRFGLSAGLSYNGLDDLPSRVGVGLSGIARF